MGKVVKIEVSQKAHAILITDAEFGPTNFLLLPGDTDQSIIDEWKDYTEFYIYSRQFSYEEYKAEADDWRVIYGGLQ